MVADGLNNSMVCNSRIFHKHNRNIPNMARKKTCSYVDSNGTKCNSVIFDPFRKIEEMSFFDFDDKKMHPPSVHCEEHLDRVPFIGRLSRKSMDVLI